MPHGFLRVNSIGSPFRSIDAGYDENLDWENTSLFEEGVKNYLAKLDKEVQLDRSMFTNVSNMSSILYPLCFSAVSYATLKTYTRPRSIYFRGIWTGAAAAAGWWTSVRTKSRVNDIFMMKNYKFFDQDMRDALATGDHRYLREYHRGPSK